MSESKWLHGRVPVTVLRRTSLLAAIGVTLCAAQVRADSNPTDRYLGRLNALVDALDDAGTNCDKASLVLERDNDAALVRLIDDVRGFTADPDRDAEMRELSLPLIQTVLETDAWRTCAKVTNVRFALAASHHALFRGSRVARAFVAQQESDVKAFEAALAAQAAFMNKLDATQGCAARASIVRANTTAKTKKHKAAQDRVLFSEDVDQMQYAANRVGEVITPDVSMRVMRSCSAHDGFMAAAYKHPFLSVFASDFDVRAKRRPARARLRRPARAPISR